MAFHKWFIEGFNCDVQYVMRAAHLSCAVAALAAQVLAVDQKAAGSSALNRQTGVYEGGGPAVMVHEERLRVKRNKQDIKRPHTDV